MSAAQGAREARRAKALGEPRRRGAEWLYPLGLIAIIPLVFMGSFSAGFTYDDQRVVLADHGIRYLHFWDLWEGWFRYTRTATLMVDYALFGFDSIGYHVHNLVWHALSTVLLFFVLRKLSGQSWLSFFTALIFAVHPIHVEAVTNISNRKDLLCMAFSMAAFAAYDRFVNEDAARRWLWLIGAILAWGLGLFSKEVAVSLPLALIAYEYIFVPRERHFLLRKPYLLCAGLIASGTLLVWYVLIGFNLTDFERVRTLQGYEGELSIPALLLTSPIAFWKYVQLLLWPAELCPDHLVRLSVSLLEPRTLFAWAALLALLALTLVSFRRERLLAFGVVWMLLHYLPVSNIIPSAYIVADRYMYIPSAGFCLVLVSLGATLHRYLHRHAPQLAIGVSGAAAVLLVAGYSIRTLTYNVHWKDQGTLWEYTLTCNPRSFRAHNALGNYYQKMGLAQDAIEHFTGAAALGYAEAYCNRGTVLFELGRYEDAIRDCSRAIRKLPDRAEFYYNRGNAYQKSGNLEKAIEDYNHAIELKPDYSQAHNNLRAVELDRYNRVAHTNLGAARLRRGEVQAAIESYERAAELGSEKAQRKLAELRR
jgi:tetratricopeptide (TPR) repeat protein